MTSLSISSRALPPSSTRISTSTPNGTSDPAVRPAGAVASSAVIGAAPP